MSQWANSTVLKMKLMTINSHHIQSPILHWTNKIKWNFHRLLRIHNGVSKIHSSVTVQRLFLHPRFSQRARKQPLSCVLSRRRRLKTTSGEGGRREGESEDDEIWVFEPSRGRGEPSPTTSNSPSSLPPFLPWIGEENWNIVPPPLRPILWSSSPMLWNIESRKILL